MYVCEHIHVKNLSLSPFFKPNYYPDSKFELKHKCTCFCNKCQNSSKTGNYDGKVMCIVPLLPAYIYYNQLTIIRENIQCALYLMQISSFPQLNELEREKKDNLIFNFIIMKYFHIESTFKAKCFTLSTNFDFSTAISNRM